MAKRLFLLLFISLLGVISTPKFLTADSGMISKSPAFNDVLTVEPEPVSEPEETYEEPVYYPVYQPVYTYTPSNYISIAGRNINIVDVDSTLNDAGDHVNKYGDTFLYGHNSSYVFGGLTSVPVGGTFTVTYSGVTTTYRVERIMIFEKNPDTGLLQLYGSGNYMRRVANAYYDDIQYSLSLMTCYGTSYGNGDASHRLVLFANAI